MKKVFQGFEKQDLSIHPAMDLVEQAQLCQDSPVVLPKFADFDRPTWLVSIVPSSTNNAQWAVVVSLSHVLNDGGSFYLLYNMLMGMEPIRELPVGRPKKYKENLEQVFAMSQRKEGYRRWGNGLMTSFMNSIKTSRNSLGYCLVDPHKIQTIKDDYQTSIRQNNDHNNNTENNDEPPPPNYISTNDILTSCLLNHKEWKYGMMTLDERNRVSCCTKDHMGEFANLIVYRCPQDVDSPALIRRSITGRFERAVTHETPLELDDWDTMATSKYAIVTNWASFKSSTRLHIADGCRQLIHFPFQVEPLSSAVCTCFIFEPRQGQLACLLSTGSTESLDAAKEAVVPFAAPFVLQDFLE